MNASQLIVKKTYFRNNRKFGRTTTVIDLRTGNILAVFMGDLNKKQCLAQLQK